MLPLRICELLNGEVINYSCLFFISSICDCVANDSSSWITNLSSNVIYCDQVPHHTKAIIRRRSYYTSGAASLFYLINKRKFASFYSFPNPTIIITSNSHLTLHFALFHLPSIFGFSDNSSIYNKTYFLFLIPSHLNPFRTIMQIRKGGPLFLFVFTHSPSHFLLPSISFTVSVPSPYF